MWPLHQKPPIQSNAVTVGLEEYEVINTYPFPSKAPVVLCDDVPGRASITVTNDCSQSSIVKGKCFFFLNGEAIKIIKPNQLFKLGKRYNTLTQEMRSVETFFVEGFQLINTYFLILKYTKIFARPHQRFDYFIFSKICIYGSVIVDLIGRTG